MAYALRALVLLASYWFGGWSWCLLCAAVVIAQGRDSAPGAYAVAPGLIWLGLFAFTGDRRLFFPFAMYQAVVFGQSWRGGFAAGSALIIALFTMIRIEQEASFRVLAVELLVAIAAALAGAACRRFGPVAAAVAASLVALAGLIF